METLQIILSSILCFIGAMITLFAKFIVKKTNFANKQKIKGIDDQENLDVLKEQKAQMIVKVIGFFVFLPGMIMLYLILKDM